MGNGGDKLARRQYGVRKHSIPRRGSDKQRSDKQQSIINARVAMNHDRKILPQGCGRCQQTQKRRMVAIPSVAFSGGVKNSVFQPSDAIPLSQSRRDHRGLEPSHYFPADPLLRLAFPDPSLRQNHLFGKTTARAVTAVLLTRPPTIIGPIGVYAMPRLSLRTS